MKIAVLVSGSGTNLQKIVEAIETNKLNAEITHVIADRPCYAIERVKNGITKTIQLSRSKKLSEEINFHLDKSVNYIVLAGFLSILSAEFCQKWANKIINIHPSLLPKFGGKGMYGQKVHQAVLNAHETETGATVHFVTHEIDEGEIILQRKVTLTTEETVETIQQKVLHIEHQLLIDALKKLSIQSNNKK